MGQTQQRRPLISQPGGVSVSVRTDNGYLSMFTASRQAGIYWPRLGGCSCYAGPDSRGNVGRRSARRPMWAKRNQAPLGGRGPTSHHEAVGLGVRDGGCRRGQYDGAGAKDAHILRLGTGAHVSIGSDQQGTSVQSVRANIRQARRVAGSTAHTQQVPGLAPLYSRGRI